MPGATDRVIGALALVGTAAHRVARAVGDAPRQGPGRPGPPGLHPPRSRLGGPLPGLRAGRGVQRPLPVAPDPVAVLGPPGGRRGRGRGGVQRLHTGVRIHLGQADLGRVVGVGRPAHPDRRAPGAVPRLPGPAPGARPSPRCGPAAAPSWRCSPPSTSRIVHFSVDWWNTLHQGATVLNPNYPQDPRVDGMDAAPRIRRPDPGLRVDAARPLPHRGARGLAGRQRTRSGPGRAALGGHGRPRPVAVAPGDDGAASEPAVVA